MGKGAATARAPIEYPTEYVHGPRGCGGKGGGGGGGGTGCRQGEARVSSRREGQGGGRLAARKESNQVLLLAPAHGSWLMRHVLGGRWVQGGGGV